MAWNGSNNVDATPSSRQKKVCDSAFDAARAPRLRGLIAGLAVILVGGIAAWLILGRAGAPRRPQSDTSKPTASIEAVKPAVVPKKPVRKPADDKSFLTGTNLPAAYLNAQGLDPSFFPYTDGRKVISTRTNDWDQIIDICIMPSGRSRKVIRKATPQTFEHVTDQLIALALSGDNDVESTPIPLDDDMEPEFLKSLETPIVISDTDSDAVKRDKQNVIEARKVIQEELRKGYSFKTILEDHLAQRRNNASMRAEAMATVRELRNSGDTEGLDEYVSKVNELLRSSGITEIGESRKKGRTE